MNESSAIQTTTRSPVVFLSYASEDRPLARKVASHLFKEGMEVFFDDWEIRAGDSIREKIDAGLGRCTHFVALLTSHSIDKAWVGAEMDAAFLRRIDGECRFIPLLYDLPAEKLPPLLRGIKYLKLGDFDAGLKELVEDIQKVPALPSLHPAAPSSVVPTTAAGLSSAAEKIVRLIVQSSRNGMRFDPQIRPDDVKQGTGLSDESIKEAVDELIERGVAEDSREVGQRLSGFLLLLPRDHLFALYDGFFMDWNPAQDALRIAADFISEKRIDTKVKPQELAERYGWEPRRLNPAIGYLVLFDAARVVHAIGTAPYSCAYVWVTNKAKRLLREQEPPLAARTRMRMMRRQIIDLAERHMTFDLRLFGSTLRGDRAAESDIDIVVKVRPGATLADLTHLEQELANLLGYNVDVVDEGSLRPPIRDKILAEATPI